MSKPHPLPDVLDFEEVTFSFAYTATVPEVTSPEAADYLPPVPARSCWLYLFREEPGAIVFAHEIHVDGNGGYREAPLTKTQGRATKRPLVDAGQCVRLHTTNRGTNGKLQRARYWIWATKARISTERLPEPLRHSSRAKGAAVMAFKRWAETRELVPVVFDEALAGGRLNKVLFPIWRQIEETYDLLEAARRQFQATQADPNYAKRLLLFAAVHAIRQQIKVDQYLDLDLLDAEGKALAAKQNLLLPAQRHAEALGRSLNGRAWQALEDDIKQGHDPSATIWVAQFIGDHAAPLEAFRSTHPDLDALLARHPEVLGGDLTERDPKAFKSSRKGAKSYWSAAKALLAGAERANPGKVARLAAAAFEKMHGVTIRPGEPGSGSAFHKDDIKTLKGKLTENKFLNVGMAVLELGNVICAISEVAEAFRSKTSSVKEKAVKASSAIGALSSLGSAIASNAKLYVKDPYPTEIRAKLNSALREWKVGDDLAWKGTLWGRDSEKAAKALLSQEEFALIKATEDGLGSKGKRIFNLGYSDALKGGLAAISGFADVIAGVTGGMEAFDFADPKSLALNGGIVLGGGLAIIAGICLAPGATVAAGLAAVAALIAAPSYVLNAMLADSELTTWLKFCSWGKERGKLSLFGSQPKWLKGNLGELYLHADRQIETLQGIVHGIAIDWHPNRTDNFFLIKYTARVFLPQSIVYIGITADGPDGVKVLKPFSPVDEKDLTYHLPPLEGESQREMRFTFRSVQRVHVTLQIDELGDGTTLYPEKPVEKKFELGRWAMTD